MSKTKYKIDPSMLENQSELDFVILAAEDLEEALAVLRASFFNLEIVHNMLNAMGNPASIEELEQLVRKTVADGVSLVAKEKATGKIVSVAACKIQEKPEEGKPGAFDAIAATFKEPESLGVMEFMIKVDGKVDMYAKYNTNILYEIMFLGTLLEHCGRHIAKDLSRACIQVAHQTPAGAVNVLCTSPWTDKIALSLGFELLYEADYSDFRTKDGVRYSDLVGKDKTFALRALPLKTRSTRI